MIQTRLKQDYLTRVVPALTTKFGYTNRHQVPRLTKVVVNTTTKDAVADAKVLDTIADDIGTITGQRPVKTYSKRAISIRGGYSRGLQEQGIFPELEVNKVKKIFGMNITFATTARRDDEARALLEGLGLPFAKG